MNKVVMLTKRQKRQRRSKKLEQGDDVDKKTKRQRKTNLERGGQSKALLGGGCDRDHGWELSA